MTVASLATTTQVVPSIRPMPVTMPAPARRRRTARRGERAAARGTPSPGRGGGSIRSRTGKLATLAMALDRALVAAGAAGRDRRLARAKVVDQRRPAHRGWRASRRRRGRAGCAGRAWPRVYDRGGSWLGAGGVLEAMPRPGRRPPEDGGERDPRGMGRCLHCSRADLGGLRRSASGLGTCREAIAPSAFYHRHRLVRLNSTTHMEDPEDNDHTNYHTTRCCVPSLRTASARSRKARMMNGIVAPLNATNDWARQEHAGRDDDRTRSTASHRSPRSRPAAEEHCQADRRRR